MTAFALKKGIFVLACYGRALIFGNARKVPQTVSKVLVIQMAKLGDMVCTTPVFRALKNNDSTRIVHVLGSKTNKDVLAGNPDVDAYLVFDGFFPVLSRIKKERYDAVVLAGGPDIASLSIALLAGVSCVITPSVEKGVTPLADIWYRLLARLAIPVPHPEGAYAPLQYLRELEPLNIHSEDTNKHLYFSEGAEAKANEFLFAIGSNSKLIAGLTPSAGNKIKEWPPERFAAVADHLIETYAAEVIVFGISKDAGLLDAMLNAARHPEHLHSALGLFSIEELKAAISKLELFIAADTGPIYIAEAFSVPTVDIVGPVDERIQPPTGPMHRIVVPPGPRVPQVTVLNAKWFDAVEARRQAEATTVEAVISEVDAVLASHNSAP